MACTINSVEAVGKLLFLDFNKNLATKPGRRQYQALRNPYIWRVSGRARRLVGAGALLCRWLVDATFDPASVC